MATHGTTMQRCQKLNGSGVACGRLAVTRVIPAIESLDARAWLACAKHAERAERQMRAHRVPDVWERVTRLDATREGD